MTFTLRQLAGILALSLVTAGVSSSILLSEETPHAHKVAAAVAMFTAIAALSAVSARIAARTTVMALVDDDDEDVEDLPIEFIDQESGVADFPRLFVVHEYEMSTGDCIHWMLTVAPGVTPSDALSTYPELADPAGPVEYRPVPINRNSPLRVITSISANSEVPSLRQVTLIFRGPSRSDSFAIRVDRIAQFLAEEYKHLPDSPEGGLADALTGRMKRVIDLDAFVEEAVATRVAQ